MWYSDPSFQSFTLLFLSYYLIPERIGFPPFDLLWHCSYSLYSSSLPHLLSPFLCLHSILPYFFTLSYLSKFYFMFQYTLVSLTPYFALFFWLCRLLVTRMAMKTRRQRMQWWKHVPFHSNCSFSCTTVSLFSCRNSISKPGNSHQSVWLNFPAFFQVCICQMPLQNFPGVTAWFEGLLFKSLSYKKKRKKKKAIWNRRIKTDYLHSVYQNKSITNAFQNIAIIIFYRLINCWTSLPCTLVGNSLNTKQNVYLILDRECNY